MCHRAQSDHRVCWTCELPELGTGWSFKENWAANATFASSLLAALLVGSDLLTELLGDGAKSALSLMAVGGAVAALLVGIGPPVLKAVGRKVETPTVGGMLAASGLATVGGFGQILLLTRVAADLAGVVGGFSIGVGGVALMLLTLVYALRAMEFNVVNGLPPTKKATVNEVVTRYVQVLTASLVPQPEVTTTADEFRIEIEELIDTAVRGKPSEGVRQRPLGSGLI